MKRITALLPPSIFIILFALSASPARTADTPRLSGTFIQLYDKDLNHPEGYWEQSLDAMEKVGIKDIVFQWSAIDPTPYEKDTEDVHDYTALVAQIAAMAADRGMDYLIGLENDPGYWEKIKRPPHLLEVYFRRLCLDGVALGKKFHESGAVGPHFKGWYIPQELDDLSWSSTEKRKALIGYISSLKSNLRAITGPHPLYISGFTNMKVDPQTYHDILYPLVLESGLDGFLLQDGIGVRKTDMQSLPYYYQAAKNALQQAEQVTGIEREFIPIIELFEQVKMEAPDDQAFRTIPTSLDRLQRQLKLATQYSGTVYGFSLPDYMFPATLLGGDPNAEVAQKLYRAYKNELLFLFSKQR